MSELGKGIGEVVQIVAGDAGVANPQRAGRDSERAQPVREPFECRLGNGECRVLSHLTRSPHPQRLSHPMGEGGVGLSPCGEARR